MAASTATSGDDATAALPPSNARLLRGFSAYTHWYVARHFDAVRLTKPGLPTLPADQPVIVYLNHPSWWDPLTCLVLYRYAMPQRQCFAPIDQTQLERYRILGRIGFFGVERGTARGAASFLRQSQAILAQGGRALWLTPEGHFRDARTRPIELQPGLAHLVRRLDRGIVLPLALEYCFWDEPQPEILAAFGEPIDLAQADPQSLSVEQWQVRLGDALEATADHLQELAMARCSDAFEPVLFGKGGVHWAYDAWRWARAKLTGRTFQRRHAEAP